MRPELAVIVVLASTLAAACGGKSTGGPPRISYGRDVCAECHMIINEARFAAAYRAAGGQAYVFDDVGDMIAHGHRAGVLDVAAFWVHDYTTEGWHDARRAWFVRSDLATPMGHGVVAFALARDAEDFAARHDGEVLRWQQLVEGLVTIQPSSTAPAGDRGN